MNCIYCGSTMRFDHTDEHGFAHFICATEQCSQFDQHVLTNNIKFVPKSEGSGNHEQD